MARGPEASSGAGWRRAACGCRPGRGPTWPIMTCGRQWTMAGLLSWLAWGCHVW